jgi:hypothetical protein
VEDDPEFVTWGFEPEYLRRIWYDRITYEPNALCYRISVVGAVRAVRLLCPWNPQQIVG